MRPAVLFIWTLLALAAAGACTGATWTSALPLRLAYSDPSWSHRGDRLVVVARKSSGETDLYVVETNGRMIRRLEVGPFVRTPSWSPDDRRITFSTGDGISIVNADGTGRVTVSKHGWTPAWSPKGRRIAFAWGTETSGAQIYVVNPNGSDQRIASRLRDGQSFSGPSWSPDGQRLAFYIAQAPDLGVTLPRYLGTTRDYGSYPTILLRGHDPVHPAWSPTGKEIAFADRARWISVLNLETKQTSRLRVGRSPTWSPDGRKIAFNRGSAIFIMNANGSDLRRVTN